jgi:hypothetical protein
MVSPGVGMVSTGPGIVDVAIISMFLVMAASAASTALRNGGVDEDDFDAGGCGVGNSATSQPLYLWLLAALCMRA